METKTKEKPKAKVEKWEIKDRRYRWTGPGPSLTNGLKSRGVYWFDENLGYEREIKYTLNQKTPFVDEFKGNLVRLGYITFKDGWLDVPREKQVLQRILSLYHPALGSMYEEHKPEEIAANEIEEIDLMFEALSIAQELDVDSAEAILRVENGSSVSDLTSKEIKRDIKLFAKDKPELFLELHSDDNVGTRNICIKAVEQGILKLSDDQRSFKWSNGRKLMTIPFDENPYSALASWFKTDEGVEVFKAVEKRLK